MVACPNCGSDIIGPPGARRVCAACGRPMIVPSAQPTAVVATARTAPGTFTAPTAPPGMGFSQVGDSYSGPKKNSVPALLSLIFGLLPWLLAVPVFVLDGDFLESNTVASTAGIIGLPLGIAAIVLGIVGIKQVNREPQRYKGRGMAIAGLTLGIVFTTMWVIAVIIIVVFCLAYIAAYGKSTAMMAPCPAVALQSRTRSGPGARRADVRLLLAHHPECGAFRNDVLSLAGLRLCASCAALVVSATVAGYLLFLLPPSAERAPLLLALAALLILLPQTLSALRWTTTRARKMLVKSTMGGGAALLFSALVAAPWDDLTRFIVLNAVTLVAVLLILPRKQRLYDEMALHEHGADCGAPTP